MGIFSFFSREARFAREVNRHPEIREAILLNSSRAWVLISSVPALVRLLPEDAARQLKSMKRDGTLGQLRALEQIGALKRLDALRRMEESVRSSRPSGTSSSPV